MNFGGRRRAMSETGTEATVVRSGRGLSIAGTRITLYEVMDYLRADWPPERIQEWLNLSDTQVADVMQYLAEHRDDVEAEYDRVVRQAEETRAYWEDRNRERRAQVSALPPKPGQEAAIVKLRERKTELGLS